MELTKQDWKNGAIGAVFVFIMLWSVQIIAWAI